ncbi:ubiquitin-specific protease ubp1 [Tilletia horrida]|uniref:Ubiquitin carboxyl-terminal hydrolase n=1 Tax=Tilletia horrida TaxID=155126 RepID=A0AAN6GJP6_9BASI|nr:ubiquitin-specific protease ubp1 [Tilletia horrida]KAK0562737.1 ubiquitin-specific protease ubp1 [Tilletia horrida]
MSYRSVYSNLASSSSTSSDSGSTPSLSSLITKLDRRLAAFVVSTFSTSVPAVPNSDAEPPFPSSFPESARSLLGPVLSFASRAASRKENTSSFVLIEPKSPQAFPLLGCIGYPLPVLSQVGLIIFTALCCIIGYKVVREVILDSPRQNYLLEILSTLISPFMVILSANPAALGSVGLSSDFPSRIANAVSSSLTHAFPSGKEGRSANGASSWSRSFHSDGGSSSIALAPHGKGRALRRSQVTSPSNAVPSASQVTPSSGASFYPGLRNTGNTCFFNSVVQSLASCPTLVKHLDEVTDFAEAWDVPTPVTDALRMTLQKLNAPQPRRAPAVLPSQLTAALSDVSASNGLRSLTAAHQQQDAHELFALLSDALESELREIQQERRAVLFSSGRGLAAAIAPTRARSAEWLVPSPPSASPDHAQNGSADLSQQPIAVADEQPGDPHHPFKGWTAQRTGCVDCGYTEGIRHLSCEELTLTVPQLGQRYRGVALEQMLDEWSKLEVVQWICHRCSLRATAERLRADVIRLGGEDPGLHSRTGDPTSAQDGRVNGHGRAEHEGEDAAEAVSNKGKMTMSKKRRLKDAQRAHEKVLRVLALNIHEDELATSSPPLLPTDLRLERMTSRCATKQIMLARNPRLLVIHLNRSIFGGFGGGASKNNTVVHYGEWLDVQPFATGAELEVRSDRRISGNEGEEENAGRSGGEAGGGGATTNSTAAARSNSCMYRLQSIVVHYGGHSFGHYVSYRRNPSAELLTGSSRRAAAEWLRISDDIVEPCGLGDVLASNPFLLFYERADGILANGGSGNGGGVGAAIDAGSDSDGSPTRSSRLSAGGLDDIDDGHENRSVVGDHELVQSGAISAVAQPSASTQLRDSADLDRLRNSIRPRVVQRWESPAPKASL